ncbi:MAG: hypothetical protein ACR2IF_06855 [Terriglobales bacterium]
MTVLTGACEPMSQAIENSGLSGYQSAANGSGWQLAVVSFTDNFLEMGLRCADFLFVWLFAL